MTTAFIESLYESFTSVLISKMSELYDTDELNAIKEELKTSSEIKDLIKSSASAIKMKQKKIKKDPNSPKGLKSAYIFFSCEARKTGKFEGLSAIGEAWKGMSNKQKEKYVKMAEQDKIRYNKEIEQYKQGKFIPTIIVTTCTATIKKGGKCTKKAKQDGLCGVHYNAKSRSSSEEDKEEISEEGKCTATIKKGGKCTKKAKQDGLCGIHYNTKSRSSSEEEEDDEEVEEEEEITQEEEENTLAVETPICQKIFSRGKTKGTQCQKIATHGNYCNSHRK